MEEPHLTSGLMWLAALIAAGVAVGLVGVVARLVPPPRFERLARSIVLVAAVFWSGVWTFALWGPWWDMAYRHVFPAWARSVVPPAYGAMFAGAALGLWWLARKLPGVPAVTFCLLGGLVSLPGHLFAFYGRGMLDKVPVLHGVSVSSALVFGVFEFITYWAGILLVASGLKRITSP